MIEKYKLMTLNSNYLLIISEYVDLNKYHINFIILNYKQILLALVISINYLVTLMNGKYIIL